MTDDPVYQALLHDAENLLPAFRWRELGYEFGSRLAASLAGMHEPLALASDAADADAFAIGVYQALCAADIQVALCCIWTRASSVAGTDERIVQVHREYFDPDVKLCETLVIASPGIFHRADVEAIHERVAIRTRLRSTFLLSPFIDELALAKLQASEVKYLTFDGETVLGERSERVIAALLRNRPPPRTRIMPDLVAMHLKALGSLDATRFASETPAPGT